MRANNHSTLTNHSGCGVGKWQDEVTGGGDEVTGGGGAGSRWAPPSPEARWQRGPARWQQVWRAPWSPRTKKPDAPLSPALGPTTVASADLSPFLRRPSLFSDRMSFLSGVISLQPKSFSISGSVGLLDTSRQLFIFCFCFFWNLFISIWFSLTICSLSNYVTLLIITSVAPYGPQDRIKISSSAFKVLNGLASYAYLSNFSWSFPCMLPIHT